MVQKSLNYLTIGLIFFSQVAYSQNVPKIVGGIEYPAYRKILIKEGWTPSKQKNDCGFLCQDQRKSGMIETQDCADTGIAPCIFIFSSKDGRSLKVNTVGENFLVKKASIESAQSFGK
jgi:hypothetical protein